MDKLELRVIPTSLTIEDGDMVVEGLVNRTECWSHTLGIRKKFREKISKGAFSKAIQDAQRIDFLAEHDTSRLLSTTDNGSLELWEDEEGLKMRATICPTSYGKDMYELMKHKLVNHMSFGFKAISDKWRKLTNGTYERIVERLELLEVSVVRNPAYPQSAIAARGLELIEDVEIPDDIKEERSNEVENSGEMRAYATYLYSKNDVINSAMNIVAECSSLSGYLMRYVGEDKDTAEVLVSLQHSITMANKIINDEIQVLVDDFNKIDKEVKEYQNNERSLEDSETLEKPDELCKDNEDKSETKDKESNSEEDSAEETTEEKDKSEEKPKSEEFEESEEDKKDERSFDLSAYRQRVKERRQFNED